MNKDFLDEIIDCKDNEIKSIRQIYNGFEFKFKALNYKIWLVELKLNFIKVRIEDKEVFCDNGLYYKAFVAHKRIQDLYERNKGYSSFIL